jgi:transposase
MPCNNFYLEPADMGHPDAKAGKVYLYPKRVDFRKSIDGLVALVELGINMAVFDPVLFVFLNKTRIRRKLGPRPVPTSEAWPWLSA